MYKNDGKKYGVRYLYVEDGERLGVEAYPNIHRTGSVAGMKKLYWGPSAMVVRCGNYYYNVPPAIYYAAH